MQISLLNPYTAKDAVPSKSLAQVKPISLSLSRAPNQGNHRLIIKTVMATCPVSHTKTGSLLILLLKGAQLFSAAATVTILSTSPTDPNYKSAPFSQSEGSEVVASLSDENNDWWYSKPKLSTASVRYKTEDKSGITASHGTLKPSSAAANLSNVSVSHPYVTQMNSDNSPPTSPTSPGQTDSGRLSATMNAVHTTMANNETTQNRLEVLTVSENIRKCSCLCRYLF